MNNDKNPLEDLDAEFSDFMHDQVPPLEPDYDNVPEPEYPEPEAEPPTSDFYVKEIEESRVRTHEQFVNSVIEKSLQPVFNVPRIEAQLSLLAEKIVEPVPALVGEDIVKIRTLTGKRRDNAMRALYDATIEMFERADPSCYYIPGNVPSSKNNKEIGVYLKRNDKGELEKKHTLINSTRVQKYEKDKAGYFLQNKVPFLNQTRHLPLPLSIEFTFIRDTLRRFDFNNASQLLADLMVKNGYMADDDSVNFVPVFNRITYYHPKMAGVLIRVII